MAALGKGKHMWGHPYFTPMVQKVMAVHGMKLIIPASKVTRHWFKWDGEKIP